MSITITPKERLLRALRHEKTDRLPISPVGMSPFTWHRDFPSYHPVLEVAARHCEFMAVFPLDLGFNYCDPRAIGVQTAKAVEGTTKQRTTTVETPLGPLTGIMQHEPAIGGWAALKHLITNDDELARMQALPFEPFTPSLLELAPLQERVGDAGLVYCNGIRNALLTATHGMSEEYRTVFCFTEQKRLRGMVERAQEQVYDYVQRLLAAGAGPVFRFYSIEDFVEPMMPPSFVDEFIVPYDREIVRLIHAQGLHVVMHCHGRLKAQIARMVAIGVDGVDCAECPPQNDATLQEMLATAAGRMFVWGYIQFESLARMTPAQVDEAVRDAVAMGGTEGRYILSQAASPWMAELPERTAENLIHMIEAGVRYGRK